MLRPVLLAAVFLPCVACQPPKPAAGEPEVAVADETIPNGVFYTTTAVQAQSNRGLVQLPAATLLVNTGPNSYRTTDGTVVTLATTQVTNNPTVLKHIQRAEREARRAERRREEARAAAAAQVTPRPWGTALDKK